MRKKKTVLKNKKKIIVVATLAIIVLALSFCLISSSLNIHVIKTKTLMQYNEDSFVDYNVSLKKNNYFDSNTLPSNQQYITSIIDKVNMKYRYNFTSSVLLSGTYSYEIVAKVNANYNVDSTTSKQVWSKEYKLKEKKNNKLDNKSNFKIDEDISLSYDQYNKIINNFKKDYMLAINSKVDVIMRVNFDFDYNNNKLKDTATLTTSIPLSEQTIEISTNYKKEDIGSLTKKEELNRFNNIYIFILGVLFGLLGLFILIRQIIQVVHDDKKQSIYLKKLKKYRHDYEDIIATSKEPPKTKGLNIIEVTTFEDMVNAQDDLRVPIIFYETKKNQEGKFYLISQDCVYCYTLSDDSTKGGKQHEKKKTKESK